MSGAATGADQVNVFWDDVNQAFPPGVAIMSGSGVELASAELSADLALSSVAVADATGLQITFTAPQRAFLLQAQIPIVSTGASTQYCVVYITDSNNVILGQTYAQGGAAAATTGTANVSARLPRIGGTAYPITPGNSYTFKVRYQMSAVGGGNGTFVTFGGTARPVFRSVTC